MKERIQDAFHKHYLVDPVTGCWNWQRAIGSHGYGQISADGVQKLAHRYSYERTKGPIPKGLYICHSCDNRRCVNPDHLWPGTCKQNHQDALQKGRGRRGVNRGEDGGMARFTSEQVLEIRAAVAAGDTQAKWARKHNVHKTTIQYICKRKTWKHLA